MSMTDIPTSITQQTGMVIKTSQFLRYSDGDMVIIDAHMPRAQRTKIEDTSMKCIFLRSFQAMFARLWPREPADPAYYERHHPITSQARDGCGTNSFPLKPRPLRT